MIDFKTRISELTTKIKLLEDSAAELQSQAFALRTEREGIIVDMIREENLLQGTNWDMSLDGANGVILSYVAHRNLDDSKDTMKFITELARLDYNSWFELSDGIQLRFDETDISISFKESKQAVPFIKKHNLQISGIGIQDRLSKMKRDVAALEGICHQFATVL